ncbi:sensor histidine kinase [Bacillus sp. FJAT-50079]|uniref:cache domain-containing sensor histidine kinase n=1 Tax=Bacillus sp. FJAT-50079 TaxID=2833577 RepID=UPI001BCA5A1F|nr:histidine kinase [Bacillus sp. FJAT-50079]
MNFVRRSIRNKLIVFLLTAIIVPMLMSIFVSYMYTKESLKRDFIRENANTVFQGTSSIQEYLELINHISQNVYNNIDAPSSLYQNIIAKNKNYIMEKEIYQNLNSISKKSKDIVQVYLHINSNQLSYLMIDGFFKRTNEIYPKLQSDDFSDNKIDPYIESTHMAHNYEMNDFPYAPKDQVITIHKPIYEVPLREYLGYISIDFKLDSIKSMSDLLYSKNSEDIYLIDNKNKVIYSSKEDLIGTKLTDEWAQTLHNTQKPSGYFESESREFSGITIYETVKHGNQSWMLAKRMPNQVLYKNANQLVLINALVISVSLIIVIIATIFISLRLTSPIKELIKSIKEIKQKDMKLDINTNSTDEVGILAQTIKNMVGTIDTLFMKEYRLEIANKDNQLKALQAQINPHFIYNTLQSIGTIALQNDVPRIYDLTTSFGKMMRYNMNTSEPIVPLAKEIDHIKDYLELQKQRFKQNLIYHINLENELKDLLIPKMILQPLVENYFKHGFKQDVYPGEIWINIENQNAKLLIITVEDNGIGMDSRKLQSVQQMLKDPQTIGKSESIGLHNVLSRIQLYFHEQAQIEISNRNPNGFKIVLSVPLRKE